MTLLLDVMTRRPRPLTNLADEDRVVLFPSIGHLSREGNEWLVHVHGDVSAPGTMTIAKRVLLRLLQRSMRCASEELATELFQQRIARFVARDRPGKRIALQIGERLVVLPKRSRRNGHFQATLRIGIGEVRQLLSGGQEEGLLPLNIHQTPQREVASGGAYLLRHEGVSVISDIDDTLKYSYVGCKRTLLTHTFLRPFQTIPGMSRLFREWSAAGAAFHYVSSSPWQLYEHLSGHLTAEGFPAGSFHLRSFRLRDHLLRRLLMLRRSGKIGVIRTLIKQFPARQFLLVGDSGEHDPEIYGAMARRFPNQIVGVYIRELPEAVVTRRRFLRAFRGVNPAAVRLFREAEELDAVEIVERCADETR
jgi:hypothetical protein